MAEKIIGKTPEEALDNFLFLRAHQPFRYAGMKYLQRIDSELFLVRSTKPKKGQEFYKIDV